jgi:hypothetical protein
MKRYLKLPEFIHGFLIFLLLMNLTGCYVYKPVSVYELSQYKPDEYKYVIKGKGLPFLLENPKISNGLLYGTANPDAILSKSNIIKIYPSPDYEIILKDSTNTFLIPIDRIAKIKRTKFSKLATAGLLYFIFSLFHW